jgi:hypothetical protein
MVLFDLFNLFRRRGDVPVGAAEGRALMAALWRIRDQGEPAAKREAEAALRGLLVAGSHGEAADLARATLERIACGPEPRAALIAGRCRARHRVRRQFAAAMR